MQDEGSSYNVLKLFREGDVTNIKQTSSTYLSQLDLISRTGVMYYSPPFNATTEDTLFVVKTPNTKKLGCLPYKRKIEPANKGAWLVLPSQCTMREARGQVRTAATYTFAITD